MTKSVILCHFCGKNGSSLYTQLPYFLAFNVKFDIYKATSVIFAKILAVLVQPCLKSPMLQQSAEEFAETSPCGFARHATSDALAYLATADSIEVAQVFRKGVEEAAGFAKCHCLPFCW